MFVRADHATAEAGGRRTFAPVLEALHTFRFAVDLPAMQDEQASALLRDVSRAEKICAALRMDVCLRLKNLHAAGEEGARSPEEHVARETGETEGRTRRDADTAETAARYPKLHDAMSSGDISPTQAGVIAPAANADPSCLDDLLEAATRDSLEVLRRKAARVRAAKESERDQQARQATLHRRRRLSFNTTPEGAISFYGELPPVEGAALRARVQQEADRIYRESSVAGRQDSHAALLADALIALTTRGARHRSRQSGAATATQDGAAPSGPGGADPRSSRVEPGVESDADGAPGTVVDDDRPASPKTEIILHVDVEALRRGHLDAGERCEIEGVGSVPLSTVEYLFGNAWAKVIIHNGVDIVNVTHLGRTISAALETALSRRDTECQVPGCGSRFRLERDHVIPVEERGPTELANLVKLCKRHHMKSYEGWRLVGRPGAWRFVRIRSDERLERRGDAFILAGEDGGPSRPQADRTGADMDCSEHPARPQTASSDVQLSIIPADSAPPGATDPSGRPETRAAKSRLSVTARVRWVALDTEAESVAG